MKHYSLARLRGGALRFMAGKLLSAAATFIAFALVARSLGLERYGVYASLLAGLELGLMLASLGVDWVNGRHVPDYRLHAAPAQFRRYILQMVAVQTVGLLATAGLALALAPTLAARFGISAALLHIYLGVLLAEGLARLLRDQFLPLLLAQGSAQGATVGRALLNLVGVALVITSLQGEHLLPAILRVELAASLASVLIGAVALARLIKRHRPEPDAAAGWQPPSAARLLRLGAQGWANSLLVFPASGAALTLVVAGLLGPAAAAAFGFVRSLVDQVRRFLPIELFLSLIRPAVVSRYLASRDFTALNRQMSLVFLVSVAAGLPALALFVGAAGPLVRWLGGASFAAAGPALAVWSLLLLLFAHRRAIEVVANTVDRADASVRGAALLSLSPLLLGAALQAGWPLPVALGLPLLADLGFSAVVARSLHRGGLPYAPAWPTLGRLLALQAAAIVGVALLSPLLMTQVPGLAPMAAVLLCAGLAVLLGWGGAMWWRPFSASERAGINAALPRPWFPF